jgi:hypothetical protein
LCDVAHVTLSDWHGGQYASPSLHRYRTDKVGTEALVTSACHVVCHVADVCTHVRHARVPCTCVLQRSDALDRWELRGALAQTELRKLVHPGPVGRLSGLDGQGEDVERGPPQRAPTHTHDSHMHTHARSPPFPPNHVRPRPIHAPSTPHPRPTHAHPCPIHVHPQIAVRSVAFVRNPAC